MEGNRVASAPEFAKSAITDRSARRKTGISVGRGGSTNMINFDRSLIGREFEAESPVEVTAEMIANFCHAIGAPAPAEDAGVSQDRLIAPPAFAGIFRLSELTFEKLPNSSRRLAAGMEIDFVSPIRAGDRITMASRILEVYEKTGRSGSMVFMVIASTLRNQNDDIVARIDHRFMHRV
jgi:acyl dehydratase